MLTYHTQWWLTLDFFTFFNFYGGFSMINFKGDKVTLSVIRSIIESTEREWTVVKRYNPNDFMEIGEVSYKVGDEGRLINLYSGPKNGVLRIDGEMCISVSGGHLDPTVEYPQLTPILLSQLVFADKDVWTKVFGGSKLSKLDVIGKPGKKPKSLLRAKGHGNRTALRSVIFAIMRGGCFEIDIIVDDYLRKTIGNDDTIDFIEKVGGGKGLVHAMSVLNRINRIAADPIVAEGIDLDLEVIIHTHGEETSNYSLQ